MQWSVEALHVPSHVGAPAPPWHGGGRQNSGCPGICTQVHPGGHVPPHGGGGGPLRHAQFVIVVPPQHVNVSVKHARPGGQSPSPHDG